MQNRSFVQLALVDQGRKSVILDIAGYPPGEPVKNQIGAREALPKQYGDAPHVAAAVRQACELGAIGLDAVRHLVLCRIEQRPPRLDLTKYPHLPAAQVEQTN